MKSKLSLTALLPGVALALSLLLTGCGKESSNNTPATGGKQLTVGVNFETLQTEYWVAGFEAIKAELKKRNIGVLITDHNVRETLDIVDRACIIYGGQVLFAGSPEDLVADANVRRLYLGESFTL